MIKNIHTHIFMNENEQQMSQLETRHPIVHTDTEHQGEQPHNIHIVNNQWISRVKANTEPSD